MSFVNNIGPLAALLAGLCVSTASALPAGVTWDWQLQAPLDLSVDVDVLALDPDEVTADDIATLTGRGVYTICYVSVGTSEEWRDDAGAFPAEVLGRAYDGWPGERFLDITNPALLPIMQARFARCAAMGFDAIEPDNIDLHINRTGFSISRISVLDYVIDLAGIAHALGLEIAQKNVPELTPMLVDVMDFAITENCFADGWCDEIMPYIQSGRAVLATEYTDVSLQACVGLRQAGVSVIFKTYDLTRDLQTCPQ